MNERLILLRERPIDIIILIFFFINIFLISYMVDLEQLIISDLPETYEERVNEWDNYPAWPPSFIIDAVHWYGYNFDPALIERPAWWRATIWLDVVLFGPFYIIAIYAFIKGKNWIRIPSIIYSCILFTNVFIILFEEVFGSYPSPNISMVFLANGLWYIMPIVIVVRMWSAKKPFTKERNPLRKR